MASQLLRIQMSGGAPYGIRLLGGEKNSLTVAKIRPSSKAQVAGLLEGDVILAINNICSQGLSHPAATSLMEGNNTALIVHVLRGINAQSEVDSAMATLGPEVKRLTAEEASALAPNSDPSASSANNQVMNGSEPYFRLQAPPSGGNLKQIRLARRESREGSIQGPDDVAVKAAQSTPGYYAREERTSTDGGKTTRIVEEVKTEKFGGTTLTKVTKQEFSSYKSSSADPHVDPFPPEFSVRRSEEYGQPVPLGAPSEGGSQLRDERGYKTSTSVHKTSVRTEPYEIRIDTTQEPTRTYVIYQDGTREELQRPELGRVQQPIPAIEIQFHPDDSDFGVEAKPSRVEANSNFEIRVGKEVTFQPKSQTVYEATHSHSEFHPTVKVHEPSGPIQSGTYSKFSDESSQTNHVIQLPFSYHSEPQSGYLVKQSTRILPQNENSSESHRKDDTHPQVGHVINSHPQTRPVVRFSAEPDYSRKPNVSFSLDHATKPHQDIHFRPDNEHPEPRYKPDTNPQFGYVSDPQPGAQSHLGYHPEPPPSTQPKSGYNSEHQSGNHPQYGYNQVLQPEINSQFGHNPVAQNRPQYQYGFDKEPQPRTGSQHEYNPEPQPRSQSQYEYNQEPQPKTQSQYGYNPEPQSRNQSQYGHDQGPQPKTQSQYGYNKEEPPNTHPQLGYSREPAYPYKPRSHLEYQHNSEQHPPSEQNKPDSHLYRPEQDHSTNPPPFGYNSQREPQFQPPQPIYSSEPKHKAGVHNQNTYEPDPTSFGYNTYPTRTSAAPPLNRQGEPQFYDSAPATHTAPAQQGKKFPLGPAGPGTYNPPEAVYDAKPSARDRGPIIPRQMDRIERVEIVTTPKWTPGSKLPTKQPSKPLIPYNSNPPLTGDPRGPQPGNPVAIDGYYDQSPEGEWHEAPVAGVKNPPNVAFSRVHDPTKQSTETEQSLVYGKAPSPAPYYGGDDYYPRYGQEEDNAPGGQQGWADYGGQSTPSAAGHLPSQGNIWRPSGYGQPVVEEMDRSRGFGAGPAPPAPPPAPPLGEFGQFGEPVAPPTPLGPPPPVAPPIDHLKAYRGNSSTDRGYGLTTLEERVKVANSVAHSVLSPENQNSRGQKIFLRRRENSHKWTHQGPDPVPEKAALQEPTRSNANVWAPHTAGATQPRQPLPASALGPHQLARTTSYDYSDINGRQEGPPSGGTASSYSLAEDMAINSGKGGRLFAKRLAKADQWASAETTGRQIAPQNIRQGAAPQSQTGYGSPAVPPSPGYGGVEGGTGGGDYPVANRLKDMINKPKNTSALWSQQSAPQSPFAQGRQSTGPSLISVGSNPNAGAYRQVRFQGTSAISSSSAASSPAAKPQNFMQAQRLTPKQFGNRAMVTQSTGYTDL